MTYIRRSSGAHPESSSGAAGSGVVPAAHEWRVTKGGQSKPRAAARERAEQVPIHPAPDLKTLTSVLSTVLCSDGLPGEVTVLDRKLPLYVSTYYSEIVTCRLPDGSERKVLCKHSAGDSPNSYGHRGGVPYEAEVYRSVLAGSRLTFPTFYGHQSDAGTNKNWLIIEFLEDAEPVHHTLKPGAMTLAAQWIGRFHAFYEARLQSSAIPFLTRYDARYYLGWSHRTWVFAKPLRDRYPWLAEACLTYAKAVDWLLAQPQTVIHGEFYPLNVLYARGGVYPVDWESTAVGVGGIDLACLTEGWSEEMARKLELEYQLARWPDGTSAEFDRTLAAARYYLAFRWLGDRPMWTNGETSSRRFEQLRTAMEGWESLDQSKSPSTSAPKLG